MFQNIQNCRHAREKGVLRMKRIALLMKTNIRFKLPSLILRQTCLNDQPAPCAHPSLPKSLSPFSNTDYNTLWKLTITGAEQVRMRFQG